MNNITSNEVLSVVERKFNESQPNDAMGFLKDHSYVFSPENFQAIYAAACSKLAEENLRKDAEQVRIRISRGADLNYARNAFNDLFKEV